MFCFTVLETYFVIVVSSLYRELERKTPPYIEPSVTEQPKRKRAVSDIPEVA
jgi:hypothetical protein